LSNTNSKVIRVKAPDGKSCPWPGRSGYTIGADAVELPNNHLVRRLVADGSLIPEGVKSANDSTAVPRRKAAVQVKKE